MMRLRRPWWVVLAAMTLVLASILAPMEAAAYVIDEVVNPVAKGDPDMPGEDRADPKTLKPGDHIQIVFFVQPIPGVVIQIHLPTRLAARLALLRRASR